MEGLSRKNRKPTSLWLTLAATAVGLGLFVLPKTNLTVVLCVAAIFVLLINPLWNFWFIERTLLRRMMACAALVAVCVALACYALSQKSTPMPIASQVADEVWKHEPKREPAPATTKVHRSGSPPRRSRGVSTQLPGPASGTVTGPVTIQPGGVASFGQQGGITAGRVEIYNQRQPDMALTEDQVLIAKKNLHLTGSVRLVVDARPGNTRLVRQMAEIFGEWNSSSLTVGNGLPFGIILIGDPDDKFVGSVAAAFEIAKIPYRVDPHAYAGPLSVVYSQRVNLAISVSSRPE